MSKILEKMIIQDKDIKIRKKYAPSTKIMSKKNEYRRKSKYNDQELWEEALYGQDLLSRTD
jgi:hypothetical protein